MIYFKVDSDFIDNNPFEVQTNDVEVDRDYYQNLFSFDNFYEPNNELIRLKLPFDRELDGHVRGLRDFYSWGLGRAWAYCLIISPQLKGILEKQTFLLPPHRFYEAYVRDDEWQKHSYYVFHFIQNTLEDIEYNKSVFGVFKYGQNIPDEILKPGEIISIEGYKLRDKQERKERKSGLKLIKAFFKPGIIYDMFALQGQIVVSERLKQTIEDQHIIGVKFTDLQSDDILKNIELVMNDAS
ncbi:hypothetical protein [Xanthocytophaga agilis]|uniref:Uncharacterized protein n=1 Tax=Xanthocytophaga agilis TaxID=3048010 RepID=A0AAE3QYP6_9BACT|nr:hypothetical protein [Xanthocytophaga agilis]MDJ1499910.1 hypothetical protein [Xanthocytophaga agilis]